MIFVGFLIVVVDHEPQVIFWMILNAMMAVAAFLLGKIARIRPSLLRHILYKQYI
jgi:hypothetical protein